MKPNNYKLLSVFDLLIIVLSLWITLVYKHKYLSPCYKVKSAKRPSQGHLI